MFTVERRRPMTRATWTGLRYHDGLSRDIAGPGGKMSRTLIDVDDELLAEASRRLGTTTKKDTVNAALAEVVNLARVHEHIEWLASGGLPDLADPEVMKDAWR
jgi:Arc/MetJ family transcription regulator